MKILRKIFGKQEVNPFDKAHFLSPWYFDKHKPRLTIDHSILNWKFIDKIKGNYVGVLTLNDDKNTLGIFNAYVYVQPSPKNDRFCVWTHSIDTNGAVPSLTICIYATIDLQPIIDANKSVLNLRNNEVPYILNAKPRSTISIPLHTDKLLLEVNFPDDFKDFDEFITVANIPNLYPNGNSEWYNTALIDVKPKDNMVYIYPQDWFNKADDIDYGYQWITRAIKANTEKILGQGFRLDNFELDDTNRQIKHWL